MTTSPSFVEKDRILNEYLRLVRTNNWACWILTGTCHMSIVEFFGRGVDIAKRIFRWQLCQWHFVAPSPGTVAGRGIVEAGSPFGREIVFSSGHSEIGLSHYRRWEPMMLGPKNIGGSSRESSIAAASDWWRLSSTFCPILFYQVLGQMCNCAKWANNFDVEGR